MTNESKKLPENVNYITIERIKNGFIVSVPQEDEINAQRYYKGTINGIINFLSLIWKVEKIEPEEKTNITLEQIMQKPKIKAKRKK
jgi:hypothetical protein